MILWWISLYLSNATLLNIIHTRLFRLLISTKKGKKRLKNVERSKRRSLGSDGCRFDPFGSVYFGNNKTITIKVNLFVIEMSSDSAQKQFWGKSKQIHSLKVSILMHMSLWLLNALVLLISVTVMFKLYVNLDLLEAWTSYCLLVCNTTSC